MEKYEVLSGSVIRNDKLYFTKVSSAECIERKLFQTKFYWTIGQE